MTGTVTGLVLAAGSSRRLGRPKQLLPLRGSTLLGCTLDTARAARFDQLVVALGSDAADVRERVQLRPAKVVVNPEPGDGCSSSLAAALEVVDPGADGIVLLLGDQPDVRPADIRSLIAAGRTAPIAVCRYRNGLGHPLWFARSVFPDLRALHGDKAVWKLLESGTHPVTEVAVDHDVPLDVDTEEDYQRLLDRDRAGRRQGPVAR